MRIVIYVSKNFAILVKYCVKSNNFILTIQYICMRREHVIITFKIKQCDNITIVFEKFSRNMNHGLIISMGISVICFEQFIEHFRSWHV